MEIIFAHAENLILVPIFLSLYQENAKTGRTILSRFLWHGKDGSCLLYTQNFMGKYFSEKEKEVEVRKMKVLISGR